MFWAGGISEVLKVHIRTDINIFINNLSTRGRSVLMEFSEDTKLGGIINT